MRSISFFRECYCFLKFGAKGCKLGLECKLRAPDAKSRFHDSGVSACLARLVNLLLDHVRNHQTKVVGHARSCKQLSLLQLKSSLLKNIHGPRAAAKMKAPGSCFSKCSNV